MAEMVLFFLAGWGMGDILDKTRLPFWFKLPFCILAFMCLSAALHSAKAESKTPYSALESTVLRVPYGTGFLVAGKSGSVYIMTNWHVCNIAVRKGVLSAFRENGDRISGHIVRMGIRSDLCVARVPTIQSLPLSASKASRSPVYTMGFPLGIRARGQGSLFSVRKEDITYSLEMLPECIPGTKPLRDPNGRLYACGTQWQIQESDLYVDHGSSGSPVVSKDGHLVGVVNSMDLSRKRMAGVIPLSVIQEFMEGL